MISAPEAVLVPPTVLAATLISVSCLKLPSAEGLDAKMNAQTCNRWKRGISTVQEELSSSLKASRDWTSDSVTTCDELSSQLSLLPTWSCGSGRESVTECDWGIGSVETEQAEQFAHQSFGLQHTLLKLPVICSQHNDGDEMDEESMNDWLQEGKRNDGGAGEEGAASHSGDVGFACRSSELTFSAVKAVDDVHGKSLGSGICSSETILPCQHPSSHGQQEKTRVLSNGYLRRPDAEMVTHVKPWRGSHQQQLQQQRQCQLPSGADSLNSAVIDEQRSHETVPLRVPARELKGEWPKPAQDPALCRQSESDFDDVETAWDPVVANAPGAPQHRSRSRSPAEGGSAPPSSLQRTDAGMVTYAKAAHSKRMHRKALEQWQRPGLSVSMASRLTDELLCHRTRALNMLASKLEAELEVHMLRFPELYEAETLVASIVPDAPDSSRASCQEQPPREHVSFFSN